MDKKQKKGKKLDLGELLCKPIATSFTRRNREVGMGEADAKEYEDKGRKDIDDIVQERIRTKVRESILFRKDMRFIALMCSIIDYPKHHLFP
jgi:hypothetical protein